MVYFDLNNEDYRTKIKQLGDNDLQLLSYDIRDFLLTKVSKTGGHLASNLGIVDITLAVHKVFDVDRDRIVWDVGHQIYTHKILTGRAGGFDKLRKYEGLSGFPKTSEDASDVHNSGHSSTSVSIAMGLAESRDLLGEDHHVVAVIGDGALTGGIAYEALTNAGVRNTKLIVILNDNGMSIAKNTGSMAVHLNKLRASKKYQIAKKTIRAGLERIPKVGGNVYSKSARIKEIMRYAMVQGSLFEDLGFSYFGPIDGHDIVELTEFLEAAKYIDGPVLIHAITKKGKGYRNAETNPDRFHGIGPFELETGVPIAGNTASYTSIAGETLARLPDEGNKIVAISAAMSLQVGLEPFIKGHPDRVFDVGIAEGHAVTFAAGLALGGMKPFVFIYSTFLQRAFDHMMLDVCYQKLPVVFMVDRAGNVGEDGETHHGIFDLSYLGAIPGLTVAAPKDGEELVKLIRYAADKDGPMAIRYPRAAAVYPDMESAMAADAGQLALSEILREGTDVEIRAVGRMVSTALEAADILSGENISVGVAYDRFVAPPDSVSIRRAVAEKKLIVTLEDNVLAGGFGDKAAAIVAEDDNKTGFLKLGWPDEFIPQGSQDKLFGLYGLDAAGVAESIRKKFARIC
ncbi:MAG: 1-deoxy-D-xylulose-5-phosphate synthase [Clostridiales Family XIII bacterium]|jgi:1-deoxy-D-xylulose-5-phosphate synthase|nr:1-deoxy-D-xylulose-5-phosphate synthase [Clostridiales Family XIII bacterium]